MIYDIKMPHFSSAKPDERRRLKSPGGAPKDPPELLEETLEPQDRTPLDRTSEDPGRQDPPRTLALVCGARGASKVARQPREEAGRMCVCVRVCAYSRCVCMCLGV